MKRYNPDEVASGCDMLEDPKGEWVSFEDVSKLLNEILEEITILETEIGKLRAS